MITSTLTGDLRPENPDNLIVNVKVTFDDALDTTADWVIDINSPLHPGIKLDAFLFNLDVSSSNVSFSNFSPAGWNITVEDSNPGVGGTAFTFIANDQPGQPNNDVNDSTNLTFTSTLLSGYWSTSIFTEANTEIGNDDAGFGQLGAHLQSLTQNPGDGTNTDSGFAFGLYVDASPSPVVTVPEPATLAIWSLLAVGCGADVRRRRKKNA
ncbi:hypothetical protein [Novipirellula artificiosorum]|nr:hypothetical protein [Novipirellula artificiosorum]